MGYALFAQRKILLTDRVNNLQLELVQVSNKMNKLEQLGSAVADGDINAMDLAQCQEAGLALSYEIGKDGKLALAKTSKEYQVGRAMLESENDKQYGGSKIGNGVCGAGAGAATGAVIGTAIGGWALGLGTAIGAGIGALVGGFVADKASAKTQAKNEQIKEYNKAFDETQIANIIEDIQKDIATMENKLDKQRVNLETRLTASQAELESVKEAEGRAIQNSTPKYAGLG